MKDSNLNNKKCNLKKLKKRTKRMIKLRLMIEDMDLKQLIEVSYMNIVLARTITEMIFIFQHR